MAGKIAVFGFLIVLLFCIIAVCIEYFIPLSMKNYMDMECRKLLLVMEDRNGLSAVDKNTLINSLTTKGFSNVTISNNGNTKQGQEMTLSVEADFIYSKLTGMLTRQNRTIHMVYMRTTVARRVIN